MFLLSAGEIYILTLITEPTPFGHRWEFGEISFQFFFFFLKQRFKDEML